MQGGVIPERIEGGAPDLPTNAFFAYGHYEGIPRVLDLMDRHGIKLSTSSTKRVRTGDG